MAQFFVGKDTLVCDAYGIKSQKQFINTLYDNIKSRGAKTTLITDGGRILGLTALNSILQCVKYSVWEVCSVN